MADPVHFDSFWGYGGQRICALGEGRICYPVGTSVFFGNVDPGAGQTQYVWNQRTGRPVTSCAFSQKCQMLVYGEQGDGPSLYVVSYPDMREVQSIPQGTTIEYADLCFTRNGSVFASLGALPDFTLSVYTVQPQSKSLSLMVRTSAAPHQPRSLSFSPCNKDELVTTGNGHITFWKVEKSQEVHTLTPIEGKLANHQVRLASHCHAPAGDVLGGTNGGDIYRFDPVTGYGEPWWESPGGPQVGGRDAAVSLSVSRHHVISASLDGFLKFFRHDTRQIERSIALPATAHVRHVTCAPEWDALIVGCGDGLVFNVHMPGYNSPQLPAEDFREIKERVWAVGDYCGGSVTGVCHLARGDSVVSISDDGTLRVWDYRRNALLAKAECGPKPLCCSAGGPAGDLVAVGSATSHLRFISMQDPHRPTVVSSDRLREKGEVSACAFSPDGMMVAALLVPVGVFFAEVDSGGSAHVLGFVSCMDSPPRDLVWLDRGERQILTAHANGDVRLLSAPTGRADDDEETGELSQDSVVTSWKLDFPVERMRLGKPTEEMLELVVLAKDKETKVYRLDKQQKPGDAKVSAKKPHSTWKDHSKLGTALIVTPDRASLISGGADGRLVLRDLSNRTGDKCKWSLQRHSCFTTQTMRGGITSLACSPDGRWVVTSGGDGNIGVWSYGHARAEDAPFSIVDQEELAEVVDDPHDYLIKRQLEHDRQLHLKHQAYRESVIEKIAQLREQLQEYKKTNTDAAEDEKLDTAEFMIQSQRDELMSIGDDLCAAKADEIRWQNLERWFMRDKLEKDCWGSMKEHLVILKPIRETTDIIVPNYNILKTDERSLSILKKVKFLRKVEKLEWERRQKFEMLEDLHEPEMVQNDAGEWVPKKKDKKDKIEEEPEEDERERDAEGNVIKMTLEEEARLPVDKLLYNKYMVFTRARTLTQIMLLQRRIQNLQLQFNEDFKSLQKTKENSIMQINDPINKKIRQIQKELQIHEEVPLVTVPEVENPKRILDVKDSEIKSRKHLSAEEQKKYEEELAKAAARKAEAEDESVTRALIQMMDGRLERDERQVKEIKPPNFSVEGHKDFKPLEEWNDDEQKAFSDYKKKVQKQEDEELKRRSDLGQELKELKKERSNMETEIDKKMQELFNTKLATDSEMYQIELQIVKLVQSIVQQEEMENHAVKLSKIVEDVKVESHKSSGVVQDSFKELDEFQRRHEELSNNEKRKTGDKDIKAQYPFSEAEEFCDQLIKLLKKGTKPKKDKKKDKEKKRDDALAPDPFAWVDEEDDEKRKKAFIDPADAPKLEKPEGLREDLWREFLDYRLERMQAEKDIKVLGDEVFEKKRTHEKVQRDDKQHQQRMKQQLDMMLNFNVQMLREGYNLDILHTFKQGQIEVEQEAVVTDYADAILIHKNDIEKLNDQIREHGMGKVQKMKEMMEFKKEIRFIEWENEMLEHQQKHYEMDLRHLHTLRVTKSMQEFIKGGQENHHEIERAKLLKKIDHVQSTMQGKIDEKKLAMLKVKRVIREKDSENKVLEEQLKEARQLVSEREEIQHLQSTGLDHQRNLKLMKDMRVTRKLEDVGKAQQEEMQLLKKEIDRLRERTFPSFAVVSKRVVGNPDQA